jgi:hypothetical protein
MPAYLVRHEDEGTRGVSDQPGWFPAIKKYDG